MNIPIQPLFSKSFWQDKIKFIPPSWRNRYLLIGGTFIIWLIFFDGNSVLSLFFENRDVHKLAAKKRELVKEMQIVQSEKEALLQDSKKLEEFARENYLMKKPNEEVIYIKHY